MGDHTSLDEFERELPGSMDDSTIKQRFRECWLPRIESIVRRGAETRICEYQMILARFYECGYGTDRQRFLAGLWWQEAARADNPSAQIRACLKGCWRHQDPLQFLSKHLDCNDLQAGDEETVLNELRKQIESGNPIAQNDLGHTLQYGLRSLDVDLSAAVDCYRRAADQELPIALHNLGICHARGWGAMKNSHVALNWLRQACELNRKEAQLEFAMLCLNRAFEFDAAIMHEGFNWLERAQANGYGLSDQLTRAFQNEINQMEGRFRD